MENTNKPSVQYDRFHDEIGPPAYPQLSPASQNGVTQVVIRDAGQLQATPPPKPWNWCVFVASIISIFFFPLFGFIATAMATLAYVDHNTKQYEGVSSKNGVAIGFAIAAYVIGAIIYITIGVIFMEAEVAIFGLDPL